MVRTYKRKTNRAAIDPNVMKLAVEEVLKGRSLRKVAEQFGLNFKTLANYRKNYHKDVDSPKPTDVQSLAVPWPRFGYAKARSVSYL